VNHWSFIAAAYAIVIGATGGMSLLSFLAMRRAERAAESLRR
jgi:hypothetical protein